MRIRKKDHEIQKVEKQLLNFMVFLCIATVFNVYHFSHVIVFQSLVLLQVVKSSDRNG